MNSSIDILTGEAGEYKLLDSGNRQKLEEVAGLRMIRSEPRAWWKPALAEREWQRVEAIFEREEKGSWVFKNGMPEERAIDIGRLKALVKFSANSKHIGFFPEQAPEWEWITKTITKANRPIQVLNLFGYTGLASLAAARAGAKVTHVDGSRTTIAWARENQALSGLSDAPIRWILDDAEDFVKREVKRGERYDAIILDPPAYGRGPKGQVWKVEDDLVRFLDLCKQVLSDKPLFIILNMYSTELSSISLQNLLADITSDLGGHIQGGELALKHEGNDRLLPLSISAKWYTHP